MSLYVLFKMMSPWSAAVIRGELGCDQMIIAVVLVVGVCACPCMRACVCARAYMQVFIICKDILRFQMRVMLRIDQFANHQNKPWYYFIT